MLAAIDGLVDLTLTTNGSLLATKATALATAGLQRVTVSLDSLDDGVFARLNDVDFPVSRVLAGITAAERAGLTPIKVNMVVRRGINEDSIVPMARFARAHGYTLRFIEYMDVGHTNGWDMAEVVPVAEILARVDAAHAARGPAAAVPRRGGDTLALPGRRWRGRRHRVGHAAILLELYARPAHRGGGCSSPACSASRGTRPARAVAARGRRRGPAGAPAPTSGNGAPIATRRSARRRRRSCPGSRCPGSAAEYRDPCHEESRYAGFQSASCCTMAVSWQPRMGVGRTGMTQSRSPQDRSPEVDQELIWDAPADDDLAVAEDPAASSTGVPARAAGSPSQGGPLRLPGSPGTWSQSLTSTAPLPGPAGLLLADVPNRIIAFILDVIALAILGMLLALLDRRRLRRPGDREARSNRREEVSTSAPSWWSGWRSWPSASATSATRG